MNTLSTSGKMTSSFSQSVGGNCFFQSSPRLEQEKIKTTLGGGGKKENILCSALLFSLISLER